jgi:hypothetical protein
VTGTPTSRDTGHITHTIAVNGRAFHHGRDHSHTRADQRDSHLSYSFY